jgi:hypothetical protein
MPPDSVSKKGANNSLKMDVPFPQYSFICLSKVPENKPL